MTSTLIQVEKKDRVALLTINNPPANALSQAIFSCLDEALTQVEQDTTVKAIIIYGEGRFFAAGADIKEFTSIESGDEGEKQALETQRILTRLEGLSKPVIAAIHGAALGGGLELALACHIRFSTPDAKLGLPELNLGIIPGFAGTQRLPRLVGKAKALELILSSQAITGEEGKELGLINQCFAEDELLDKTLEFAKLVSSKSPLSLAYVMNAVRHGEEHGIEEGSKYEAKLFGDIFESANAKEGIQAFIEKRKPNFKD
jgi:enoyl-CoA hydratase